MKNQIKYRSLFVRGASISALGPFKTVGFILMTAGVVTLLFALGPGQRTRADSTVPAVSAKEMNAAVQDTMRQVLANDAATNFVGNLEKAVSGFLPLLHPEVAEPARLQDPVAAAAHNAAMADFLNPTAVTARLMQDPAGRQQLQRDLETILQPAQH